jgi:hypothetical protein
VLSARVGQKFCGNTEADDGDKGRKS